MAREESDIRYTVPVDPVLDEKVKRRLATGGFSSMSEYVRGLLRADVEQSDRRRLEELLLEGLEGDDIEMNPKDWSEIRTTVRQQLAKRRGDGSTKSS